MIVKDRNGNKYKICNQCEHWVKRPVPRCECPYHCHDKARQAEKRRRTTWP